MKKKIIAALVGICTVVVMTGCGNKGISNDKITIKQYKGLEVEKVDPVEVTDTDVEDSINSTLQTKSTQNDITDRQAQEGDVVTIDYEGKKDGVAFDGGTAQDQQLELGSGSFIDGFEDGIVGHNIGETFDLNLTFPEDYKSEDLTRTSVGSVANILGGQMTGLTTVQYSGEPGSDAADIFIRGKATWSDAAPLIQVDGVERGMNDIDPNEIESITILKDASATAVFGVRGANGVILITTKRGKEGKARGLCIKV